MKIKLNLLLLIVFVASNSNAQNTSFSKNAIKTRVGIAVHSGNKEDGMSLITSIGYQRTLKNTRMRINPQITAGSFSSGLMLHTREQHYRLTSLALNGYIDALKYGDLSLFAGTGVSLNYSRGLLGTGGDGEIAIRNSEYFHSLYYAAHVAAGLRIAPAEKRIAYSVTPFDIHFGNKGYILGMGTIDIEIKLNAKK